MRPACSLPLTASTCEHRLSLPLCILASTALDSSSEVALQRPAKVAKTPSVRNASHAADWHVISEQRRRNRIKEGCAPGTLL